MGASLYDQICISVNTLYHHIKQSRVNNEEKGYYGFHPQGQAVNNQNKKRVGNGPAQGKEQKKMVTLPVPCCARSHICLRIPSQKPHWQSAFLIRIQVPIADSHPLDLLLGAHHTDLHECLSSSSAILTCFLLSARFSGQRLNC